MTNFRRIDMLAATPNPGRIASESPETQAPGPENAPAVEQSSDEVPSGSAAEVLAWVDGDKGRAQQALDKEKADSTPRKGLSADLQELIGK